MSRTAFNFVQTAAIVLLIAALPICCCNAQLVMSWLAPAVTATSEEPSRCAGSCCGDSSADAVDEAESVSEPESQHSGCCTMCCLKAMNINVDLINPAMELRTIDVISIAIVTFDDSGSIIGAIAIDDPHWVYVPPTLLRQRCALII